MLDRAEYSPTSIEKAMDATAINSISRPTIDQAEPRANFCSEVSGRTRAGL